MTFNLRKIIFEQLAEFPYFTLENVLLLAEKYKVSKHTTDSYIKIGLKNNEIVKLKKNHYVTRVYFEEKRSDISYIFFLANKLRGPSYVSLESALQYYGIFTEAVNITHTSVSSKIAKQYNNKLGIYKYRKIKSELFDGFILEKGNFEFYIAEPYKAVFDYLYYRTDRFRTDFDENKFEELRVDIDFLDGANKAKLKASLKKYAKTEIKL